MTDPNADFEAQLEPYSATLVGEFRTAADAISGQLQEAELREWAEAGLDLARQSWRSWEAAGEYFRVTPQVLPLLGTEGFREWAKHGRELAELSSALAASYFRASPATIPAVGYADALPEGTRRIGDWMGLGRMLYKGTWRSASLAVQFFDASPHLFSRLSVDEVTVLVRFVDALCDRSYDLASHCLTIAPSSLEPLSGDDRTAFLVFAEALASTGWADARSYLERGPALLAAVQSSGGGRGRFLTLSRELARREGRQAFTYFAEAARALASMDPDTHGLLLSLAEDLMPASPVAAMEFLKAAPSVAERITVEAISEWHAEGIALLDQSQDGGEAYFRLESARGEQVIDSLSSRVELSKVSDILRMYGKALTGAEVAVHSSETLSEKGIGWVDTEVPSTEGTAIFLPPHIEEFTDKNGNFQVYKVYCTHQAGHLEFGTFGFQFDRPGNIFPTERHAEEAALNPDVGAQHAPSTTPPSSDDNAPTAAPSDPNRAAPGAPDPTQNSELQPPTSAAPLDILDDNSQLPTPNSPLTDMERFFDLFPDRKLAADLFSVAEDARIDVLISAEYTGIRRPYGERQERELGRRDDITGMPLRQAFVENLVRVSLGALETTGQNPVLWPRPLMPFLQQAITVIRQLQGLLPPPMQPIAARGEGTRTTSGDNDSELGTQDSLLTSTVEDAAEATLRLYRIAESIPNLFPEMDASEWEQFDSETMQVSPMAGPSMGDSEGEMPKGEETPYQSPQPVDFRGEFKPETVQLLMKLRNQRFDKEQASPLSPEQLQQMLEKSVEISISDMAEADLTQSSELFLTNLIKELNQQNQERAQKEPQPIPMKDGQPITGMSTGDDEHQLPQEPKYFYYDEWDFRAGDYRPGWCRIVEYAVGEGEPAYFEQTVQRYSSLVADTRRQFELLRPEMFRKIKRLYDGEDLDFDAVIEHAIDRRSGVPPSDRIYWRRNKIERDVGVAFLLDMSASTDEEIAKHERKAQQDDFDDDPRRYFSWWMARRAQELLTPPKRIIDLEKESMVLLIKALETIGDAYGIYGFSGYGRDNVEFYVVKDLEEQFGDVVKKRIDKIAPVRSTRMGPAIRHAAAKLEAHDSKVRILFLVSDGRPQDHGYGRDRTEKEYAIHDTHQALMEAKRKGITPFCLTVDRYGHDYLKTMCEDIGYEVVPDIESLPSRITTLYRQLTA
jgi:hypothetical protein